MEQTKKINIVILKETNKNENRVAMLPEQIASMLKKYPFLEIYVEANAGLKAGCSDQEYKNAGAKIGSSNHKLCALADICIRINPPPDSSTKKK